MSENTPVKRFRIGFVTASIFKNDNGERNFYSVTLQRSWKDDDEWRNSGSMGHADLLNAACVLTRAEQWIGEQ
jgi:hypothetical protein